MPVQVNSARHPCLSLSWSHIHRGFTSMSRVRDMYLLSNLMMCEKVTHIVSELSTRDEVVESLTKNYSNLLPSCEILSVQWFVSCMEANDAILVTDEYRLPSERKIDKTKSLDDRKTKKNYYQNAKYACQRSTPVSHTNRKLTNALEVLEKHAEFLTDEHNNSRALAFRKASAALKAYPSPITSMSQAENLKDLKGGQHCKQVVQEILEDGFCSEVDKILSDEWYKSMQIFTGVFGCGPVTAKKWYEKGCRTLEDVKENMSSTLTKEQKIGIECYNDLNTPVSQQEAEVIKKIVYEEAVEILPGTTVAITGGFSRGKEVGHDVDLLISHPEEGRENGLLQKLLHKLHSRNLLIYTGTKGNSYSDAMYTATDARKGHMDHYARCFSVFNLQKSMLADNIERDIDNSCPHVGEGGGTTIERNLPNMSNSVEISDQKLVNKFVKEVVQTSNQNNLQDDHVQTDLRMSKNSKNTPSSSDVCFKSMNGSDQHLKSTDIVNGGVARRVDLIMVPASQYPYALLGWTGSRMFIRSIRDYSRKEMNMILTSHGLYDKTTNKLLPAKDEREIFQHLNLEYREPWERNC
ncbi:DNA-directed DNA/RNA polymerase mu-like isoform X2 [Anneissia japonica]|uniref:DNA-directed DNA/RNA polymerase mu-like isoform X2 n=1 Tax=Anneissia japonica TaxID=1529436 RepID=UPI0014258C1E|nr:DNA-directed DNA/RNA polymerase mu-like isoform X2 [Anneissia japonica]